MIATRLRWKRIALLVLSMGLSIAFLQTAHRADHDGITMMDFGEIYYGAHCALHHHDPYNAETALKEFKADGGELPVRSALKAEAAKTVVAVDVNLPTTLFLASPLAWLPWATAQMLWLWLSAGLLVLAGYLVWSLADNAAPVMVGCLIAFMLLNCVEVLWMGNVAAVAVSLCVIATWCFVKERFAAAGVLLLAISLALKPHDSGFVWLYFLLAGGLMRKRALQAVFVTAIIGVLAATWLAPSSPHWLHELQQNNKLVSQVGGTSDPSLTGLASGSIATILDLQAPVSLFLKAPAAYNAVSYVIIGGLIAAWALLVLRRRATPEFTKVAIATIAVLTLLPVYHRPYDAKLLLLSVPACAMLWAEVDQKRWVPFAFTAGAVLLTSDIPLIALLGLSKALGIALPGDRSVLLLLLPPMALLAMGIYFLWMLWRHVPDAQLQARVFAAIGTGAASAHLLLNRSERERAKTEPIPCVCPNGVNR
jgi:hypothetical protein